METLLTVRRDALPELGHDEVQVFRLWAKGDAEQLAFAMSLLSASERVRATQYRFESAREEFATGRAALRVLLGSALRVEPGEVDIQQSRYGKPFAQRIEFSVTHSRGLIYVAMSRDAPVGVDVEWIDPALEVMELAEPNFTTEETLALDALPSGAARAAAFCRMWTGKEAVAKADGRGLGIALKDIALPETLPGLATVPVADGGESVVIGQGLPQGSIRFQLREMETPQGFAGALSVRDSNSPIVCRFFLFDLLSSGVSYG